MMNTIESNESETSPMLLRGDHEQSHSDLERSKRTQCENQSSLGFLLLFLLFTTPAVSRRLFISQTHIKLLYNLSEKHSTRCTISPIKCEKLYTVCEIK